MLSTFDTKQAFEAFAGHGFSKEQAEVLTEYLQRSQLGSVENLATKNDVKLMGAELRSEMGMVRSEMLEIKNALKAEADALEAKMVGLHYQSTIKTGGMIALGIGVLAAMIQFG